MVAELHWLLPVWNSCLTALDICLDKQTSAVLIFAIRVLAYVDVHRVFSDCCRACLMLGLRTAGHTPPLPFLLKHIFSDQTAVDHSPFSCPLGA